ncbi:MAG TPA: conjugal transfer protein TraF [Thermodesulfobacteriota bacterium]|nr:conjugal transfer protein TraF [Thermodesulfobacteriota bacterium]
MYKTSVTLVLLLLPLSTLRVRAEEYRYFDEHHRGWFWYEIIKELQEKKAELPHEQTQASPLTVEDIRKRGEELFNRAVLDPTPENVREYMAYQKLMLDRSQQFAEVWRSTLWENPQLDETVRHPTSSLGIQLATAEDKNSMREVITKLSQSGELIFFFTTACPYCQEESRLLKVLQQNYPIGIMAVSLDGAGLPDWGDYQVDRGQARNLGVTEVPALFLLVPPDKVIRVSTGLVSYDELEKRLYLVGQQILGINRQDYPPTQAFLSGNNGIGASPALQEETSDSSLETFFKTRSVKNPTSLFLQTEEVSR